MIRGESPRCTRLMLTNPRLEIFGVTRVEIAAAAMEHISPEGHVSDLEQGQSFDKLRTNGCPGDIREYELRTNGCGLGRSSLTAVA